MSCSLGAGVLLPARVCQQGWHPGAGDGFSSCGLGCVRVAGLGTQVGRRENREGFCPGRIFFGSQRGCGGFVRLQDPRDISVFSSSRSLIYWIGFSLPSVPSKSCHQNGRGSWKCPVGGGNSLPWDSRLEVEAVGSSCTDSGSSGSS